MKRLGALLRFLGFFAVELVRSNLVVAREVLLPRRTIRAAVVPVRVRATTDLEVGLLTALLALTPGTLPVEVDRTTGVVVVVVHSLHTPGADALRRQVRDLEDRLLEVLR